MLAVLLATSTPAIAGPALRATRYWVRATHAENRRDHRPLVRYHQGAEHCPLPVARMKACRWRFAHLWHHRYRLAREQSTLAPPSNAEVIRVVFGPYGSQAVTVARCESHLHTTAVNGQYRGLFQMGSWERATYGHGPTAYDQAIAAHAYFVDTGRDWSPWDCQP